MQPLPPWLSDLLPTSLSSRTPTHEVLTPTLPLASLEGAYYPLTGTKSILGAARSYSGHKLVQFVSYFQLEESTHTN